MNSIVEQVKTQIDNGMYWEDAFASFPNYYVTLREEFYQLTGSYPENYVRD